MTPRGPQNMNAILCMSSRHVRQQHGSGILWEESLACLATLTKETAASAKALPHLTLFCYKDCQLVEVTAGRFADDEGLHCWVTNAVDIQSERPHSCSHHAIPVTISQSHSGNLPVKAVLLLVLNICQCGEK